MISGQRVLALIPARGGSKRLPGKNIKCLAGKPLIAWSIDFARAQDEIDDVIVSTDSQDIAEVARKFGADVPWLRPASLASDTASSVDVVKHALNELQNAGRQFEYLVLMQPTTPFRDPAMLQEALIKCHASGGAPVVAFCNAKTHPSWCFWRTAGGEMVRSGDRGADVTRSQDLPPAYQISGSLYVVGVERFLQEETFFSHDMQAVISTKRVYDCDIDDEIDWHLAEALGRRLVSENANAK